MASLLAQGLKDICSHLWQILHVQIYRNGFAIMICSFSADESFKKGLWHAFGLNLTAISPCCITGLRFDQNRGCCVCLETPKD